MAGTRQVLPLIDLRSQEEKRGLSSEQRNRQAINNLLQTLGKAEQTRRERQNLDRVATALASGASITEAIAAASQPTEFGTGIQGILQKVGGAFQTSSGGGIKQQLQQAIIGQRLQEILSPTTRPKPFTLSPGQERFTGKGERIAGTLPKGTEAFQQTTAERSRNRDIKILTNKDSQGNLRANEIQQAAARRRLRANPSLQPIQPGQIDDEFKKGLKGKTKERIGRFDKAFGKKAYDEAIKELKDQALIEGATETSVIDDFNRWWDEQVEKEKDDIFKEFIPRSEFQDATETGTTQPAETSQAENVLNKFRI